MAKIKLAEPKEESPNSLILDSICSKYGNIIRSFDEVVEKQRKTISFGPSLDFALSGGVKEGNLVLLAGPPKAGKTSSMLQLGANFQDGSSNRQVFFANIEARLDSRNLLGVHNLKPENFKVIESNRDKILSGEEHLRIIESIIKSYPDSIILIDSLSAICPESESVDDLTGQVRSGGPRLLSQFCKRMRQILSVNNVTLVATIHVITNTSGYGKAFLSDSGMKVKYYSDIFLEIRNFEPWKAGGDDTEQIGQKVNWQCTWSSTGAPNRRVTSYIRYGYGIDNIMENVEFGVQLGLILKAGSWFSFGDIKCQGQEKLRTALLENPQQLELLGEQVKEMLV